MSSIAKINQRANRIFDKSSELSFATPNVINKRLTMFAMQNPLNNHKELREMEQMVTEKQSAFMQSWQNMFTQTLISQQRIASTMMDNFWKITTCQPVNFNTLVFQISNETLKVIEKGIHPIYLTATANARRLA